MSRLLAILTLILFSVEVQAYDLAQYSKYFEVDLNEPLPDFNELEQKYIAQGSKSYDRKYDYHWNTGDVFDQAFRVTITSYGGSEKRLRHEHEKSLEYMITSLPPETYQYIGPFLHTVPNMPEKILNMPGIKETKNKFPKRIAPQLQDIEDIEFLSPYLYVLLMPEAWPDNAKAIELPQGKKIAPKIEYDPKFFAKIKAQVAPDAYVPGAKNDKLSNSDLRTIEVTEDSLLTAADVKAFVNTIDKVNDFYNQPMRPFNLVKAGTLLDMYEADAGAPPLAGNLKQLTNPCKRLVQKVRMLKLEAEFQIAVGEEGFDLNSWAYTCDRTIKAYRVSKMSSPMAASIRAYKKGMYDNLESLMGTEKAATQFMIMQSVIDMYDAPVNDILEMRKNRDALTSMLKKLDFTIAGEPVAVIR